MSPNSSRAKGVLRADVVTRRVFRAADPHHYAVIVVRLQPDAGIDLAVIQPRDDVPRSHSWASRSRRPGPCGPMLMRLLPSTPHRVPSGCAERRDRGHCAPLLLGARSALWHVAALRLTQRERAATFRLDHDRPDRQRTSLRLRGYDHPSWAKLPRGHSLEESRFKAMGIRGALYLNALKLQPRAAHVLR